MYSFANNIKITMMLPELNFGWFPVYFQVSLLVILLICFLPFSPNNKVRYYGCTIVYVMLVSLAAIFLLPVFMLRPLNVRNSKLAGSICKYVSRIIGIRWDIRNGDVLKVDRGAVIVSNHQSMFDILGIFEYWYLIDKCTVIAKKELFYCWPFGLTAWLAGVFFIDRLNKKLANQQLIDQANAVFKDKTKMWIFPEGTRNRNRDTLLPFKRGAFKVAIECQVPVIPVVFSPYYFLNCKDKILGRGLITVSCLDPISTEGLTEADIESLMDKVRTIMVDQYEASKREVAKLQELEDCKKID